MSNAIHPQARTTPKIRQEIKDSGLSDREAAKVFNITRATAAKWIKRDDVQDRSHRAHTLHTTLSAGQEAIVLSLRQTLYLPLDDLLYITRQYINVDASRSGLARLLKREGMARLEDVIPTAEGEKIQAEKTFKDYEPGFVHIDIKYLPQMPDETSRRYFFVAIDRAMRWVFLHIYHDMSDTSSIDFLRRLKEASPIKISKILTDNGSQVTDRFTSKDKQPSGRHVFDKVCAGMGIEHRWRHLVIHKLMAWSSASMAVSASFFNKPASTARPTWRRRCTTTSSCTTITYRSALSVQKLRSRRSKNGNGKSPIYL
jgi:transposase